MLMYVADGKWVFEFSVKFYPPEPSILQEELTRSVDHTWKLSYLSIILNFIAYNLHGYSDFLH